MADYTFAQLEGLWIQAGGNRAVAPVMAAIALAESSGNPQAINPTDNNGTQTSWGLWQISDGTHSQPVANILDPLVNAQQAVAKYNASGFGPWGTYATGAYTRYLPKGYQAPVQVNTAATGATGGGGSDPFSLIDGIGKTIGNLITSPASVATGLSSIAHDFGVLSSTLNTMLSDMLWLFKPGHWIRVMCFGFGIMMLLPGVWMLSKAGSGQGDVSLALGIGLVMAAGMLLFLAFHNLPDDVTSLQNLLGYISTEIRSNSPATTG
jgi:hypothetical protein